MKKEIKISERRVISIKRLEELEFRIAEKGKEAVLEEAKQSKASVEYWDKKWGGEPSAELLQEWDAIIKFISERA